MQRLHAPSSPPRGFSFVEALVLVAIVGVLVALLLPMLQRARESARQATCADHCRRFGMALAAYEDAKEEFPPGSDAFTPDRVKEPPRLHAWSSLVLPFLDELPVALTIDYAKPWNDPAGNVAAAGTPLAVYVCPSGVQRYPGKQDYGGVMGTAVKRSSAESLVDGWEHAGVLYATDAAHPQPVRRDQITDGLAQTLLVAEAVDRGTFGDDGAAMPVADGSSALWACGTSCILLASRVVNDPAVDAFWSTHPGGVECLFADGHVVFLTESVDADVLVALVTKAGGEEVPVGF